MPRRAVTLTDAQIELLQSLLSDANDGADEAAPKRKRGASRRLPIILTADEVDALLGAACHAVNVARTPSKQLCAWRTFVMIQTGLLAGPRVSELCDLKVGHIDLAGAVLSVIEGKGKKDRNVSIGAKLLPALREWIGARTSGWLFPGPKGRRLSPRTVQRRLVTLAKAAGITKNCHPHMLRHSFATALLKKGVNLRVIQEALGHSSVAITEIYTHVAIEDMKKAVDLL